MTKEALNYLLETVEAAIQSGDWKVDGACDPDLAIRHAKAALAQPEHEFVRGECVKCGASIERQEPVAWVTKRNVIVNGLWEEEITFSEFDDGGDPAYYNPPQRTWVGLTDDEIWKFWCSRPEVSEGEDDSMEAEFVTSVRAVLAAHGIKEKNT